MGTSTNTILQLTHMDEINGLIFKRPRLIKIGYPSFNVVWDIFSVHRCYDSLSVNACNREYPHTQVNANKVGMRKL